MDRRQFLLSPFATTVGKLIEDEKPKIYSQIVSANDASLPGLLVKQERKAGHRWRGGIRDNYGIHTAGATAGFLKSLVAVYHAPGSRYHRSPELLEPMVDAARYMRAAQHADGTIDLHTTNFHSPPDTAFALEPMCAAFSVLRDASNGEKSAAMKEMEPFIRAAGDALVVGGIHTPNHRWVVCSALARVHSLFPNQKLVARIDDWLGEGIDIDSDGQFSERSTSIYSPVCDHALLTCALFLKRPGLLDPVRKNLEMTLSYLHADGEVATEVSRRQDQYIPGSLAGYYIPYRYLAIAEKNRLFAAAARLIEDGPAAALAGNLIYFLETPALGGDLPAAAPLPADFARYFKGAALVRIRRGPVSASVLAENPTFFSFHKGSAALVAMRIAAAFFGKGQFSASEFEVSDGRYKLRQSMKGPYYQPLQKEFRRSDGDWTKVDRSLRTQSEVQSLEYEITITEDKGRFEIEFDLSGTDDVPVAVELGFKPGGSLQGVQRLEAGQATYILREGMGRYRFGNQEIEFGPGFAEHDWTRLRGALPPLEVPSVYLTGYTPFRRKIHIH